jgi:hypothetical protein
MSHASELISEDILAYLDQHENKEILSFLTCGSVDDGKSTLIGRLLHDSKMIYEDQLDAIKSDSVKVGTQGDEVDLALLRPPSASSSSPTRQGTSSTPGTWRPARPPATSPSF